jgi:hypothetical protein
MQRSVPSRPSAWSGIVLALAAGAFVFGSSCGTKSDVDAALSCPSLSLDCSGQAPSYAGQVAPIIQAHCAGSGCHSPSDDPNAPWAFDDEDDVAGWSFQIQGDLSDCLMPPHGRQPALSEADRETLNDWIACGAPDN